jgi:hypothetical protein
MPASCSSAPLPGLIVSPLFLDGQCLDSIPRHFFIFGQILAAMRQRLPRDHRAGIAPVNATATRLPQRLTEQNSALGVHGWPALPVRKGQFVFAIDKFGKDPECQS